MRLKITKMFLNLEPQNGVEILRGSRVQASMFGSSIAIFDLLMKMSENQSQRGIIWSAVPLACFIQFLGGSGAVAGQQPQ